MKQYFGILDSFYESDFIHGDYVLYSFEQTYKGSLDKVKLQNTKDQGFVSFTEVFDFSIKLSNEGYKVLNVSFGFGSQKHLNFFATTAYKTAKEALSYGLSLVFASGNFEEGSKKDIGSSFLSANPWTLSAGAAYKTNQGVFLEDYSLYHPSFTSYFLSGISKDAIGTSFAAPKLSGLIANLQQSNNHKLSQSEVRTLLDLNSEYFLHKGEAYRYIDADKEFILQYNFKDYLVDLKSKALYSLYLQRLPDPDGYKFWLQYSKTNSIEQTALAFKNSEEYQTAKIDPLDYDRVNLFEQVQSMYHLFLNRQSDDQGAIYWTQRLLDAAQAKGATDSNIQDVAIEFVGIARLNNENISDALLF